jgi:argininosuccinate lyase
MQHAQVSTIAHQLLSWERPLERGLERLRECYRRVNASPAGTVAGTGTDFPIDRERTADLLGFEGVTDNAADATCNADVDLEVPFLLALILEPIDTAVQRLLVWNTSEFGYVSVADEHSGTSSVMPQKKNPMGFYTILTGVDRIGGAIATAMTAGRRLDGRYRIDVTAVEDCVVVETFETVLSSVTFDRDRAREGVSEWALATDLAGLLVREAAVPWRSAHQICAILCRRLADADESLTGLDAARVTDVASEYLGKEIDLSGDAIAAVLDADRAVESRRSVPGSPAPEQVHSQLEATDRRLAETREWLHAERSRIEAADQTLSEAVDALTADNP